VAVDAVTRGDPAHLRKVLVGLGMQRVAVYSNDVGGWLPVSQLRAAAALGELVSLRASMPRTRGVTVTSQGDFAQRSDVVRANNPGLTGAGVTVGILSDSFNCYSVYDQPGSGVPASGVRGYAPFGFATDDAPFDETNGYLPSSVNVLEEAPCMQYGQPSQLPFADEGRGMMQIVHDVAPGAALAFYTASDSEADFATGIGALGTAGAAVIADDVGYFDEPFFQDGIVAQAIDAVNAKGVAYFSAAGNNGELSYENNAPSFATAGSGANAGEMLLTFGMNGGTAVTALPVTIPPMFPGEFIGLILQWDEPYVTGAPGSPGASSNIDLCVTNAPANSVVLNLDGNQVTCTGTNAGGVDAVQVLILGNPASNNSNTASQAVNIVIGLKNTSPTTPHLIKLVVADDGAAIRAPRAPLRSVQLSLYRHRSAAPRRLCSRATPQRVAIRFSSTRPASGSQRRNIARNRTSSARMASILPFLVSHSPAVDSMTTPRCSSVRTMPLTTWPHSCCRPTPVSHLRRSTVPCSQPHWRWGTGSRTTSMGLGSSRQMRPLPRFPLDHRP
jgi:hypothetical protein